MAKLIIVVKGDQAEAALKSLSREAKKLGGTVRKMDDDVRKTDKGLANISRTVKRVTLSRLRHEAETGNHALERTL